MAEIQFSRAQVEEAAKLVTTDKKVINHRELNIFRISRLMGLDERKAEYLEALVYTAITQADEYTVVCPSCKAYNHKRHTFDFLSTTNEVRKCRCKECTSGTN